MLLLPRTTDNSTYFAQSLEIRGIESRLYNDQLRLLILPKMPSCCIILLINVKMPTAVGILTFMSRLNVMLRLNERENNWITSRPGHSLSLTSHEETMGPYLPYPITD